MTTKCPTCGDSFKALGTHWRYKPEHRPEFTDKQREIIIGLLMGDGTITSRHTPRLKAQMTNLEYLEYLQDEFGVLSIDISVARTAEEGAAHSRNYENPNADPSDYNDIYDWGTRAHPSLSEYADWYIAGQKIWPENIELTPTVLKHWYCGDGHMNTQRASPRLSIGIFNESDNASKLSSLFTEVDLPSPRYNIYDGNAMIRFTVDESREIWNYMGDPLPGFEYKWPKDLR